MITKSKLKKQIENLPEKFSIDSTNMTEINLAYYQKKDWNLFLESIDDKDTMYSSWKEWNKAYIKLKKQLILEGFTVKDVVVNIDELVIYCKIRGIENNGKARSMFIQEK